MMLMACLSSGTVFGGAFAAAQDGHAAAELSQEEILERILELRAQIEDLLESLPPEMRDEVERRWRERSAVEQMALPAEQPAAPAPSEPPAPPETAPAPTPDSEPIAESTELSAPESDTPQPTEPTESLAQDAEPALAPPACGGIHLFDTNEDALLSGGDRHWRFLGLWFDGDADGALDETEIEGLFALGVRQIDVALKFYLDDEGATEDIDVEDLVWLRQVGKNKAKRRSGALIIDADRLARDGRLWLVDADGTQLSGFQPLVSDIDLETRDGERLPLLCGDSP